MVFVDKWHFSLTISCPGSCLTAAQWSLPESHSEFRGQLNSWNSYTCPGIYRVFHPSCHPLISLCARIQKITESWTEFLYVTVSPSGDAQSLADFAQNFEICICKLKNSWLFLVFLNFLLFLPILCFFCQFFLQNFFTTEVVTVQKVLLLECLVLNWPPPKMAESRTCNL